MEEVLTTQPLEYLDEATIHAIDEALGEINLKGQGFGTLSIEVRNYKEKWLKYEVSIDLQAK